MKKVVGVDRGSSNAHYATDFETIGRHCILLVEMMLAKKLML